MDTAQLLANLQRVIDLLLRYVVPGGSAVLVFGLLREHAFGFLVAGAEVSVTLLLLVVFTVGPAIYGIHRAVLHPIILCGVLGGIRLSHKDNGNCSAPKTVRGVDIAMSDVLNAWKKEGDPWVPYYEAWAAQIHFLYGSAWGVCAALALAFAVDSTLPAIGPCIVVAAILLACGLVSDVRLSNRQFERTFCLNRKLANKPMQATCEDARA